MMVDLGDEGRARDGGSGGGAQGVRAAAAAVARESMAQGTLEYAITLFAMLSIIAALAALWRAGAEGAFVELAEEAASHLLGGLGVLDIALY